MVWDLEKQATDTDLIPVESGPILHSLANKKKLKGKAQIEFRSLDPA